jgi:pyruvate dehydrogenase E1 component alpha subunit
VRQRLTPSGGTSGPAPFDLELTRRLYRAMVFARSYDRKGTALQKQGRLATYAPFEGQEAAQIGAAAGLEPNDWVVATYRDGALMWAQGYPWELLFAGRTGDERGGSPPEHVPVMPPSITVGGHMAHAVGLAWAEKLQESGRIALTSFGDGATSEGDFHEAMNFAAVYEIGCVFLCQNNGYAISLPREMQTRSGTIAEKAIGYGMPGVQVDGNDLFAVYETVKEAADRARNGEGPTLIEAVTYRVGPHTTSDDPTRYRDADEAAEWIRRDPLERVRIYLSERDAWDDEWQQAIETEAAIEIDRAIQLAESMPPLGQGAILDSMFETLPPHLERQRIELTQAGS